MTIECCTCCGNKSFRQDTVLWPALIKEWAIDKKEVAYINRQQGLVCEHCNCNLRSITLAAAILRAVGKTGTLEAYIARKPAIKVLELNEAGNLNKFLEQLPNHTLASYPEVDIQELPYNSNSFDVVVHSDTLEHVSDPVKGLSEVWRVMRPGGWVCYTIPVVVGRMSKRRGSKPSYHGSEQKSEYLVITEYGADMWRQLFEAGFSNCQLVSLDYPASIAILAQKDKLDSPSLVSQWTAKLPNFK